MDRNQVKTLVLFILFLGISASFLFSGSIGMFTIVFLTGVVLLAAYLDSESKLFSSLGFQKKKLSWVNLAVWAPITGFVIVLVYRYIMVPIVTEITGIPIDISDFDPLRGNLPVLLTTLIYVWVSAAFGEEIVFRGYLMTRFSKIFGNGIVSVFANIILFGIFFGAIHFYQGITGQVLSGITGAIIATLFHLKKNDLWFCIIVHGSVDTIALTAIYLNIF